MPTTRPRHQITETPDVQHALDAAAERWPGESRSRLLLHLVELGSAVLEREQGEVVRRRREAIDAISEKYADAFGPGYLADLRRDWAE